jgi:hypothetical protein
VSFPASLFVLMIVYIYITSFLFSIRGVVMDDTADTTHAPASLPTRLINSSPPWTPKYQGIARALWVHVSFYKAGIAQKVTGSIF